MFLSEIVAIAGRLSGNLLMTGNVLLNGRKRRLDYGGVVSNSRKFAI